MPKKARELSATEVRRLEKPGHHAVGGVAGLLLQVSKTGSRSWVLRTMVGEKRRDVGLGGFPDVPLAQAREKAREIKDSIRRGLDPVAQRKAARSTLRAQQAKEITFEQAAAEVLAKKRAESSNRKHAQQWENTLKTYAFPVLGNLAVKDIDLPHVLKVLEPHWESKTETMTRVRQRIEAVLDWAKAKKYRDGENPAAWRGNLNTILAAPGKVAKPRHHAALPYRRAGEFMADLRTREGLAARALEFSILTAARSGEVRGATWDEIELQEKVWTIPAERMKAEKEHRVPLSDAALSLLKKLPRLGDLVFPAARGGVMSENSLNAVIKRMNQKAGEPGYTDPKQGDRWITAHGFRSTFRTWAGDTTAHPREILEQALAHTLSNAAEAAYSRGEAMEKRRRLMADWADYLSSPARKSGVVVNIKEARA